MQRQQPGSHLLDRRAEEWLRINVGGTVFQTSRGTLTQVPSRLARWCEDEFRGLPVDDAGLPFIDRDPSQFAFILNYLRGYELSALEPEVARSLLEDAVFFEIDALEEALGAKFTGTFLAGAGVSEDRKTFSTSHMVSSCSDFVERGSYRMTVCFEKAVDDAGVAVVSRQGDARDRDIQGRYGTVSYSLNGVFQCNLGGLLRTASCTKIRDGECLTVELMFTESSATITFTHTGAPSSGATPDSLSSSVQTVTVPRQPLRIVAWVQGASSLQLGDVFAAL